MLFAAYIPSWEGALRALPAQCLVVGALALALFAYARQRHGWGRTSLALALGLFVGVVGGLSRVWFYWAVSEASPAVSREQEFEWDTLAFFELGPSALAAAAGLIAGWMLLEFAGWLRRSRSRGPVA